jgi:hypothetical protein
METLLEAEAKWGSISHVSINCWRVFRNQKRNAIDVFLVINLESQLMLLPIDASEKSNSSRVEASYLVRQPEQILKRHNRILAFPSGLKLVSKMARSSPGPRGSEPGADLGFCG